MQLETRREAEVCPDHIHMLVEIPPHLRVASNNSFAGVRSQKTPVGRFWEQSLTGVFYKTFGYLPKRLCCSPSQTGSEYKNLAVNDKTAPCKTVFYQPQKSIGDMN